MTLISVVIPYFQRKAGILKRALTSVLQQNLSPNIRVQIIVVDDGSPVAAKEEVVGLKFTAPFELRIVEQENSGVAVARNAALKLIENNTSYVAFLDSDDIWDPEHLTTAVNALDRGYDFYFCDSRRIIDTVSGFNDQASRHPFNAFLKGAYARSLGDDLFELEKGPFFSQSLRTPGYRIPVVVYRWSIAPLLTFDSSFGEVGEDTFFLLQLISLSRKLCCSTKELAIFADGVNISASKITWDNPGHLIKYLGTVRYYNKLQEKLTLSHEDAKLVAQRIRMYHRIFAFLSVRYFCKTREIWPQQLKTMALNSPGFFLWYPGWVIYILIAYPLKFYDPVKSGDIYQRSTPAQENKQQTVTLDQ